MSTTTASAIRDRMISLLHGLTPLQLASHRWLVHEELAPFPDWADQNPQACLRRFSVLDLYRYEPPAVSNTDVEWVETLFGCEWAYPATLGFLGLDNARDVQDLIASDHHQVDDTLGTRGYANYPSGTITTESYRVDNLGAVILATLTLRVRFHRSMP